jgi:hypothetical protein
LVAAPSTHSGCTFQDPGFEHITVIHALDGGGALDALR